MKRKKNRKLNRTENAKEISKVHTGTSTGSCNKADGKRVVGQERSWTE